jgi:putative ABC transport system substrate-binding protein
MRRRDFLKAVGSAVASCPTVALGQERQRRIGILSGFPEGDQESQRRLTALIQALKGFGWSSERNLKIDFRGQSDANQYRRLAEELVQLKPDLLIGLSSTLAVVALKQATRSIPILFINLVDPVGSGIVESLSGPNGNVTGFTNFEYSMVGKWLELLTEIAPEVVRVAVLFNPITAPHAASFMNVLEPMAKKSSIKIEATPLHAASDIASVFEQMKMPGGGLIATNDTFIASNRKTVIRLADQYKIPAVYPYRYFAVDGGLVSYGADVIDTHKRAASYVNRILGGEAAGNLPVQQPTKFELIINRKAAGALGLNIPQTLLATADEVIE